jgi:hypothetical protein
MDDFSEVDLNRAPAEVGAVDDRPSRAKWVALGVTLLVVGGFVAYSWLGRTRSSAPTPSIVSAAPDINLPPSTPLVEGDRIPLPSLADSDPLVRELITKLSTHPQILAWLATKGRIANFAVMTLNISEGRTPVAHVKSLAPRSRFTVIRVGDRINLDPASYRRYDDYAAAVASLDATGTARLYLTLKPRIIDAYRELGHPEGDFDPVLERAMAVLLAVPVVEGDIPLREKVVSYEFVDQDLQSLSAAQKQFLRMGPANIRIVQGKLREIAKLLGLHPDSLARRVN